MLWLCKDLVLQRTMELWFSYSLFVHLFIRAIRKLLIGQTTNRDSCENNYAAALPLTHAHENHSISL